MGEIVGGRGTEEFNTFINLGELKENYDKII